MAAGPGQAIELGVTYISVVGETDKLAKSVRDAIRDAQVYASAHPLKLKADVDVSHIGSIQIPVTADTARLTRDVKTAVQAAQRNTIKIPLEIDSSRLPAQIARTNREIARLFDFTLQVKIEPDFTEFPAKMNRQLAQMQRLFGWSLTIPVDIDGAAAIVRMALLRRQLAGMLSPPLSQEVDVDVDVDKGILSRLGSVTSAVKSIGSAAGLASAGAAGIAAIGGAAGAALGAVGALGVGIASLGPIAAAAGATAAVGLSGVKDAFTALSSASDSAGSDAQSQAKAVAAAQEQVESALEGVASAQRNVVDAQKDAEDATKDVAQAYKDAQQQLEDYQLTLADAALSEKEAALALREAQKDVATAKTPEAREKALLRVERAQLTLTKAQEKNRDVQEEAATAQAKGVEGSDLVVAAKEKQAKADQAVTDAQDALAKANKQVAKAQQAVTDAMNQGSSSQDKAAQALAKLSPNAQAFVLAMRDLGPAWTEVRKSVQDNMFAGLDQSITRLAKEAMPTLKTGMGEVATSLNGLTLTFADFWRAPANLGAIQSIFQGTARFIDGMGPGLQQATTGFLSLGQAFAPVAQQIGNQLGGMLGQIGQAFTDAFQSGALTQLISNFGNILQGLGAGLNPLIDGLIQMGNIVGPALGPLFAALGQAIQSMAPALGQLGATFANTLTAIMPDLANFISALATGLEPVLPVIGDLLQSLMTALTPLIDPLSQIAQVVGIALSQAITALAPAMKPLGDAFVSLITALSPVIPVIATVVAGLIQALAPALAKIFDALGPVITQVADLMMPIFKQLQPILADVAMKIGTALADALQQLAPHLPDLAKSFADLVAAVAPLLPQLIDIGVKLLPPVLDVVIAILPQIQSLIDLFTWLVKNVLEPYVIPQIQKFGDTLAEQLGNAADLIKGCRNIMETALTAISGFFTGLGSTATQVWGTIVSTIKSAVREIGKFLVGLPEINIPDLPGVPGRGTSVGFGGIGRSMVDWANADSKATGGRLIRGPGTGTSDSIPALVDGIKPLRVSDGEFISTAKAYDAGAPLLHALNAGWVPPPEFLAAMVGDVPGFAGGGTVRVNDGDISDTQRGMWSAITSAFPDAVLTSATRYADVGSGYDYHMQSKAIDIAGPNMLAMAEWIAKNYPGSLELIHANGFGHNIKNGKDVGNGYSFYGSDTMAGHGDHVHWAMSSAPSIPTVEPNSGAGAFTGGGGNSGGTSGGGGGGGGTSGGGNATGGGGTGGSTPDPGGTTYRVWISNWPSNLGSTGYGSGANPASPTSPTVTSPTATTTTPTSDTPTANTTVTTQQTHPLQGTPLTGELFTGNAPWYMAGSPEQALTNLQSQAQTQWQSTVSDVQGFFSEDNLKEMLETGLSLAGIGATGGMGGGDTYNFNGMDPKGSAMAVERVQRRRTLAQQRGMGGIGR